MTKSPTTNRQGSVAIHSDKIIPQKISLPWNWSGQKLTKTKIITASGFLIEYEKENLEEWWSPWRISVGMAWTKLNKLQDLLGKVNCLPPRCYTTCASNFWQGTKLEGSFTNDRDSTLENLADSIETSQNGINEDNDFRPTAYMISTKEREN